MEVIYFLRQNSDKDFQVYSWTPRLAQQVEKHNNFFLLVQYKMVIENKN